MGQCRDNLTYHLNKATEYLFLTLDMTLAAKSTID